MSLAGRIVAAILSGVLAASSGAQAERAEILDRSTLRVCADPASPPSSTRDGKGFENRIAELFGRDLGVPVVYTWFPTGIGFYRRTLNLRQCDIVIGTVVGIDIAATTKPYYRSTYVLVTRAADPAPPTSLTDPAIGKLALGVQSGSPAADVLARAGMLDNLSAYPLTPDGDTAVGRRMIDDVTAKRIDGAVVWGPIGAYFAATQPGVLRVIPLAQGSKASPLAFDIGMALRFGEAKWKARIEQFITDDHAAIEEILMAAHVPLLPPVETGK